MNAIKNMLTQTNSDTPLIAFTTSGEEFSMFKEVEFLTKETTLAALEAFESINNAGVSSNEQYLAIKTVLGDVREGRNNKKAFILNIDEITSDTKITIHFIRYWKKFLYQNYLVVFSKDDTRPEKDQCYFK